MHRNESPATPDRGSGVLEPAQPTLVRIMTALEDSTGLDGLAARMRPAAHWLVQSRWRRDLLLGRPLGHAVHPFLTDAPMGAWMSALVLDVAGPPAATAAARTLIGVGVLGALPTMATGLAEWSDTERPAARVGIAHAGVNALAVGLFAASYLARGRDRHRLGVALSVAGTAVVSVGGYLGAHLSIARKVGSRDPAFTAQP